MSKEEFRNDQKALGHTVEVGEEHLDINGVPVRTVMYRSKDYKEPPPLQDELLLPEKERVKK